MKTCPSVEQLEQLADGHLPDVEVAGVSSHVAECSACRTLYERLGGTAPVAVQDDTLAATSDGSGNGAAHHDDDETLPPPPDAKARTAMIEATQAGKAEATAGAVTAELGLGLAKKPRQASAAPRVVAGYEILAELGRGGMGVVYKARQTALNRLVALKMILAGAHADAAWLARFRTEAEAVAQLQHPNIVQIYEVGEHDGLPFFSLEFVGGGDLASQLDGTPLDPRSAARLVETVARAVDHAHQHGIVHRDLKPANILVSGGVVSGESSSTTHHSPLTTHNVKISDFGLAKRLDQQGAGVSRTGDILGTPSYMAPEQAGGKPEDIGPAADTYALGAILYELLTGRPPFRAATPLDTVLQVVTEDPVPPTRLQSKVPRDLETICLKCLAKEPHRRYASAAALADDLQRFAAGEPIAARPASALERAWKWARRRPALAALAGVSSAAALALVLMGVGYNAELRSERDRAEAGEALAQEQKGQAEASARQARAALATAEANFQKAEANFKLARHVVDDGITRLSEDEDLTLEDLRHEMLDSARRFYEKFLEERGDDPALRAAQGSAYRRLAMIKSELGARESEGLALHQKALAIFEQLVREHPDNLAYRRELGLGYFHLGRAYRDTKKLKEAEQMLQKAETIQQELLAKEPGAAVDKRQLARTYLNLGLVRFNQNGRDIEATYRKGLEILEQLGQERPLTGGEEDAKGDIYFQLGHYYLSALQLDKALEALTQAQTIEEKLVAQYPRSINYQSDLAGTYADLGRVFFQMGDRKEARAMELKSLAMRERLAAQHPLITRFLVELGKSYRSLGDQSSAYQTRHDWYSKAIVALSRVLEQEPKHFEAQNQLAHCYLWRAHALNRLGRYGDAANDWEQWTELGRTPGRLVLLHHSETLVRLGDYAQAAVDAGKIYKQDLLGEHCYDLARVYALCARAVRKDSKLTAKQSDKLAETYGSRGLDLLGRAYQGGALRTALSLQKLEEDPDFQPITSRPEFQRMAAEWKNTAKEK